MNTDILCPFLNRDEGFDPSGWFQLVPKGTFKIKRKEGEATVLYDQVVDDVAVEKITAAFTNRQAADPGYRALIDYEHFSHDTEKSSEAAAWINRLEARADGVWAQAEWTEAGAAAVKSKRYRYLSPVWLPSQVERLGPRRVRPVEV
jgi:phage I-like protein